jgi:hypothetical protein
MLTLSYPIRFRRGLRPRVHQRTHPAPASRVPAGTGQAYARATHQPGGANAAQFAGFRAPAAPVHIARPRTPSSRRSTQKKDPSW